MRIRDAMDKKMKLNEAAVIESRSVSSEKVIGDARVANRSRRDNY